MNKKTLALTKEQYTNIITTMKQGFTSFKPNQRIATALTLEANIGIRISDILNLKLNDIVKDADRYRLDIVEQKTGKKRVFTVPFAIYQYIENYCLKNNIKENELIFPIKERVVQKQLKIVCDYLGLDHISTHSFRKMYATNQYQKNNNDIYLVKDLLNHASIATTQKYIMLNKEKVNKASKSYNIGGIKY